MTNVNIGCHRVAVVAAAVLLVERVVGIEVVAAVEGLLVRAAGEDVAKPEVSAAKADTARIAGDHRRKTVVEAVEIVPAAALQRPNAVPSFWQLIASENSARA